MAAAKKPKTKRKPPDPKAKPAKRNRRGKATGVVADALDEEFAILYLTNGRNATAACRAMRPDLTVASTYQQAGEWLRKPVVQRIIKEHTQKIIDDHRHELSTLVTELAQIGMFDIKSVLDNEGKMLPLDAWPLHAGKVISAVETKVLEEIDPETKQKVRVGELQKLKLWSKPDALDKLVRILGGFEKDNKQQGDLGIAIIVPPKVGNR